MIIEKKWKPKTNEDFPNLLNAIKEINADEIMEFDDGTTEILSSSYKLSLRINVDEENGSQDVEILDDYEELYYGGFRFEKTLDKLNEALRKDTDDGAYFDCVCPGRWSADFEGKYRYNMESLKGHIECEVKKAILNYMISNDKHPDWGIHKEKAELLDECIEDVVNVIKTLF